MTRSNDKPKRVDTFGHSHVGSDRQENADQFLVAELKRAAQVQHASESQLDDSRQFGENQAHVLLVADGLGGQPGAPDASRLVVDGVIENILNAVPWAPEFDVDAEAELRRRLKQTVVSCNEHVLDEAQRSPSNARMASTMTMAFVRWPHLFVVHAGDSRAYLIRDGKIERLTRDHSVAQRLVDRGDMPAERADRSRFANVLWNAVGGDRAVVPDLETRTLRLGDTVLLCTDGVSSQLNDDAILHVVESHDSAEGVGRALIDTVVGVQAPDDATVAISRFVGANGAVVANRRHHDVAQRTRSIPKSRVSVLSPHADRRQVVSG